MALDPSISLRAFGSPGAADSSNIPLQGNSGGGGGGNPLTNLGSTLGLVSSLRELQGKNQAGEIIASSPDTAAAIRNIEKSGNAGFMLPQLGQLRGLQTLENQVKEFNTKFSAMQEAGKLINAAPNEEAAVAAMMKSPNAAWLVPQINAMRELRKTGADIARIQTETTGLQQGQNRDALQGVIRATTAAGTPQDFDRVLKSQLESLPPGIAQRNATAIRDYRESVLGGNPDQATYDKNRLARAVGAGITSDTAHMMVGTPAMPLVGGIPVPGMVSSATGGFTPAAGGGNALTPPPVATPDQTWTGKPMIIRQAPSSFPGAGILGANAYTPDEAKRNEDLQTRHNGLEKDQFESTSQMLGNIHTLDKSYDELIAGKGKFLTPGALADARLGVAKIVNLVEQATGNKPTIDPSKVAVAEDFNKVAGLLAANAAKSSYGASHLAAQTIQSVANTIPQLSNTYLGGKLLVAGAEATAQRIIDQRKFENAWMADPRNKGSLAGAAEEFNSQHPAQDYAQKVLDQFGMSEKGFANPEAIGRAYQQGYLTRKQANEIGKKQFPAAGWE
jgi:hypothetical protein